MIREIKFRVWDSSLENMVSHDLIVKLQLFGLAIVATSQTQPMQYIGLKDKNGKEIYEGDVVRCKDYGEEPIGVIVYRGDGFVIDWKSETDFNNSISVRLDTTEVIGNIYENPELLGGK